MVGTLWGSDGLCGGAASLTDLKDVNVTEGSGINGYVLTWNQASGKWIAAPSSGGSTTLAGLSDVNVTEGPGINGYVLTWNNGTSKWIASPSSGSIGNIQLLSQIPFVSGGFLNYYVSPTGNDSNNGSASDNAHAWLTIQHALDVVNNILADIGGVYVQINILPGTYVEANGLFINLLSPSLGLEILSTTSTASDVIVQMPSGPVLYPGAGYILCASGSPYFYAMMFEPTAGGQGAFANTSEGIGIANLVFDTCTFNLSTYLDGYPIFSFGTGASGYNRFYTITVNANAPLNLASVLSYAVLYDNGHHIITAGFTGAIYDIASAFAVVYNTYTLTGTGTKFNVTGGGLLQMTFANALSDIPGTGGTVTTNGSVTGNAGVVLATTTGFPPCAIANLVPPSMCEGVRGYVTNSSQTAAGNYGAILSLTTGSNKVPVTSDGVDWRIE